MAKHYESVNLQSTRTHGRRRADAEEQRSRALQENVGLDSAIGYVTPEDMLAGRQKEIHNERDRKLEVARKQRQIRRQKAA